MSLSAVILAGGLATRLRPVSESIPKILIEVAGRPFAEHQIELLQAHDIDHVVLCVGHMGEMVRETLGDGSRWNIRIDYSFDGKTLLGTGGALRRALPLLGDSFFVTYGDAYLDCPYETIEAAFRASGKLGLMTVLHNKNHWDRSNIVFANKRIVHYDKRNQTSDMEYIDYGLGVLQAKALEPYPEASPFDLSQVYKDLIQQDQLSSFEVSKRFYEIGSFAGLDETRRHLSRTQ